MRVERRPGDVAGVTEDGDRHRAAARLDRRMERARAHAEQLGRFRHGEQRRLVGRDREGAHAGTATGALMASAISVAAAGKVLANRCMTDMPGCRAPL